MKTTFRDILIFIICLLIIATLVDFVNYRLTLNTIKKEMPTSGIGGQWIKGFGYIPFVWGGDFQFLSVTTLGTPNNVGEIDHIFLQIDTHEPFLINIKNSYGDYHSENGNNNIWYNQDFVDAEIYCKVDVIKIKDGIAKVKVLLFVETEERHWIRIFKFDMKYKVCSNVETWFGWWTK